MARKFSGRPAHDTVPFKRLPARVWDVRNGAVCWTHDGSTTACGYGGIYAGLHSETERPINCDRGGCLAVQRAEDGVGSWRGEVL